MELLYGEQGGGRAWESAVNGSHRCRYSQHQHHRECGEVWADGGGGGDKGGKDERKREGVRRLMRGGG